MAARAATRPVIGIYADLLPAGKTAPSQARLNLGYADSVFNAGGLPLVIPPLHKDADVDEILSKLDGFVLSGGLDLDPRHQKRPGWRCRG